MVFSLLDDKLEFLANKFEITLAIQRVSVTDRLVVVATVDSEADTLIQIRMGNRSPLLAGSTGRCVAAYGTFSRAELKEKFSQVRWHVAPKFSEYLKELQHVRLNGWAIDESQCNAGVTTIAAPVFNGAGFVTN